MEKLGNLKTLYDDINKAWEVTAETLGEQMRGTVEHMKAVKKYLVEVKGYSREDVNVPFSDVENAKNSIEEMEKSIGKTKEAISTLEKEILLAEVGMSKFAKALFRIPILGKAVQMAITGIKVALASIGIGLIIQAIS